MWCSFWKCLYRALTGIIAMWCSFWKRLYRALTGIVAMWCSFWKRLYRALTGIVAMWCSFGSVFIEHLLESSRCGALLESSLSNNDCWPSLNRLVKISVHVILDIGIVMRVC